MLSALPELSHFILIRAIIIHIADESKKGLGYLSELPMFTLTVSCGPHLCFPEPTLRITILDCHLCELTLEMISPILGYSPL